MTCARCGKTVLDKWGKTLGEGRDWGRLTLSLAVAARLVCINTRISSLHAQMPIVKCFSYGVLTYFNALRAWLPCLQVYPDCDPNAHSCSTDTASDEANKASDEAVASLLEAVGSQ